MMDPVPKPFFITIPHSGEQVPVEAPWLKGLEERVLMCDVDRFVDRLYSSAIRDLQIPHVIAQWHRYAIDLNRVPADVDADSVEGSTNPSGSFTRGLHWVKTTKGQQLMPGPITRSAHDQLVDKYFDPFHKEVRKIYSQMKSRGIREIYHIDAHSMPSKGTQAHRDPGETRADVVVSDCEGKSCSAWFKDLVISSFRSAGFNVAYNWPYVGGRVTETYGHPDQGQHAIQVELNRALYMDEESKTWLDKKGESLKPRITKAVQAVYAGLPEFSG